MSPDRHPAETWLTTTCMMASQEIQAALAAAALAAKMVKTIHCAPCDGQLAPVVIELQDCLLGLQTNLVEAGARCEKLASEKRVLKAEIERLEHCADTQKSLLREGNAYYRVTDGRRAGPYCLTCWDVGNVLVNLVIAPRGVAHCGRCEVSSGRRSAFHLKPMSAGARSLGSQVAPADQSPPRPD